MQAPWTWRETGSCCQQTFTNDFQPPLFAFQQLKQAELLDSCIPHAYFPSCRSTRNAFACIASSKYAVARLVEFARMHKKYKTDKLLPPTMDPSESPKQHALFGCPSHVLFLCDIRLTMPPALPEASLSKTPHGSGASGGQQNCSSKVKTNRITSGK